MVNRSILLSFLLLFTLGIVSLDGSSKLGVKKAVGYFENSIITSAYGPENSGQPGVDERAEGDACDLVLVGMTLIVNSTVVIDINATYDTVIVENGGELVVDSVLTVNDYMVVESGGKVTHTLRQKEGLRLEVPGTLVVESGGAIDVAGKGLRGGLVGSTGMYGETFNSSGAIVAGASPGINYINPGWGGGGGSYGGIGAIGHSSMVIAPAYGTIENPIYLGSGGGGSPCGGCNGAGGNGGGKVIINAGSLVVDGSIKANGAIAPLIGIQGGGGSGGSIRIDAGMISGAGIIEAKGGNGVTNFYKSSSGGGGRVAIYFNSNNFPENNISVSGGNVNYKGSSGTLYLKDNAEQNGKIIIDNNGISSNPFTPLRTDLTNVEKITVRNRGRLNILDENLTSITLSAPLDVLNNSSIYLGANVTLSNTNAAGFDLNLENSTGTLDSASTIDFNSTRVYNSTLNLYENLSIAQAGDFELSGSTVNIYNNTTLSTPTFDTTNFISGTINLTGGAVLDIASNEAVFGITLIKDGSFGSNDELGDITVVSGGQITHSTRFLEGLKLQVSGTLEIQHGGSIDVDGKGLLGGLVGSTGMSGETFDTAGAIVAGASPGINYINPGWGGGGGSYGGIGAIGHSSMVIAPAYGTIENPIYLGSGGGGSPCGGCNGAGGNGGGKVIINAGNLVVHGSIKANGAIAPSIGIQGGGGSGGSIRIDAGMISGAGIIEAKGGNGVTNFYKSSSGGGGRVAIYVNSNNFPENNISVSGGNVNYNGSSGTLYLKDNAEQNGKIIIDNDDVNSNYYTPLLTSLTQFRGIEIVDNGHLSVTLEYKSASLLCETPITLLNNAKFSVEAGKELTLDNGGNRNIEVDNSSLLHLKGSSQLNVDLVDVLLSTVQLDNNSTLEASTLQLDSTSLLHLKESSLLDAGLVDVLLSTVQLDNNSTLNTSTLQLKGSNLLNSTILDLEGKSFSFKNSSSMTIYPDAELIVDIFDDSNTEAGSVYLHEDGQLTVKSDIIHLEPNFFLQKDGKFGPEDLLGELVLKSGTVVTHTDHSFAGLNLNISGKLEIQSDAKIDAVGKGLHGGSGLSSFGVRGETYASDEINLAPGPTSNATSGGGGSFGGLGGSGHAGGDPNSVYGDEYFPDLLGSGGSSTLPQVGPAGDGGGKIRIKAQKLVIDGIIDATGGKGVDNSRIGGGSGGSILIFSDTISGNGTIHSNGGDGGCQFVVDCGGGGGGGRVAIYTHNPIFPANNIYVDGGYTPNNPGNEGTVVYLDCDFENNVGIDTILSPVAATSIPIGTTIIPVVIIRNISPTATIFSAEFEVPGQYLDETYVNLESGERDTITYSPWKADENGTFQATARIKKEGDNCDFNNEKMVPIAVSLGMGPVITNASPGSGGNNGSVTVEISGENFYNGIIAWLQKDASQNSAHYVEFVDDGKIFASFNLGGMDLGMYDVFVQNLDGQSTSFLNGFEVTQGPLGWGGFTDPECLQSNFDEGQLLEIEISHPEFVRPGWIFPFSISYKNNSNIDIPVPIRILVSEDPEAPNPMSLNIGDLVDGGSGGANELTLRFEEEGGPPNVLRAGASGEITVYIKAVQTVTKFILIE